MITICFTGHRPEKLYGYNLKDDKYLKLNCEIIEAITDIILKDKNEKEIKFITGGALGTDQICCNLVHNFRKNTKEFKVTSEISVPFKSQPIKWRKADQDRYYKLLQEADIINYNDKGYINEGKYHPLKMQIRNMYMVNNSDYIIAVWDGIKQGGTWNCIKYAREKGKKIIYINPNDIK